MAVILPNQEGRVPHLDRTAYVDAHAQLVGDVVVGPEASIWARAVLRAEFGTIQIGGGSCVLDGVVMESGGGTMVGRDCVIGPSAKLTGVELEDATFVGAGAIVPERCCVKTGGMVAQGAVLAEGLVVPAGFRAQGNPAELVASGVGADVIRQRALEYRKLSARYRSAIVRSYSE